MLYEVSVSELKRDLSAIINQAAYGKQRIVIGSRGKPKAAVISMEDLQLLENFGENHSVRSRQMLALEAARTVRAETARAAGSLPDCTEELEALRETRIDELSSLY